MLYCQALKEGKEQVYHARVAVVGSKGTGKSCLVRRIMNIPFSLPVDQEKLLVLQTEIASLLQKRAIEIVTDQSPGFYSRMFVVPKRSGG